MWKWHMKEKGPCLLPPSWREAEGRMKESEEKEVETHRLAAQTEAPLCVHATVD